MPIPLNQPLDDLAMTPDVTAFLDNLQANILNGHGRNHVALLFLKVTSPADAKNWIHGFPVTSALKQLQERQKFVREAIPGEMVKLLFVSKTGLDALGKGTVFGDAGLVIDEGFEAGLQARKDELADPTVADWEPDFRNPSDVLVIVAHDDLDELSQEITKIRKSLTPGFSLLAVEEGVAYRNVHGDGIEHFGYVDGRSQPLLLKSKVVAEEAEFGNDQFNPLAPLDLVLVPDPIGGGAEDFGSYFVFRKLEQNVKGFKEKEQSLADALKLFGEDRERAGAMAVGRFEDGSPLVAFEEAAGRKVTNNFNYNSDSDGLRCPFQGHIRKTMPRGSSPGGIDFDLGKRMARRGITYGERTQDAVSLEFLDRPTEKVGLLFMAYQASIVDQFEFVQKSWANNENFPSNGVGVDPVIGQGGTLPMKWEPFYGEASSPVDFLFEGFVKMLGGEYYFAPSISGLGKL